MVGRGGVGPVPGAPFRADSNELLFVSIALTLTEMLIDCDGALIGGHFHHEITNPNWVCTPTEIQSHDQKFIFPTRC